MAQACTQLVVVFVISPHIPDASTYMISSFLPSTRPHPYCRQINFGRRPLLSIFPLPRCLNYVDSSLSHCQLSSSGPPCDQGDIKNSRSNIYIINCLCQGESCYRHPLLRGDGLCFPSSHLQPCSISSATSPYTSNNCSSPGLEACCGQWCCPQEYFRYFFAINANQVQHV